MVLPFSVRLPPGMPSVQRCGYPSRHVQSAALQLQVCEQSGQAWGHHSSAWFSPWSHFWGASVRQWMLLCFPLGLCCVLNCCHLSRPLSASALCPRGWYVCMDSAGSLCYPVLLQGSSQTQATGSVTYGLTSGCDSLASCWLPSPEVSFGA